MMDDRDAYIPLELMRDKRLTPTAKLVYAELTAYEGITNREIAENIGLKVATVYRARKKLIELGYIDKPEPLTPQVCKEEVLKKQGNLTCEWCGAKVHVLHGHHYPMPKKDGGTEVVNICPNCHHDFHYLEGGDK